jgi:hypothetical protein
MITLKQLVDNTLYNNPVPSYEDAGESPIPVLDMSKHIPIFVTLGGIIRFIVIYTNDNDDLDQVLNNVKIKYPVVRTDKYYMSEKPTMSQIKRMCSLTGLIYLPYLDGVGYMLDDKWYKTSIAGKDKKVTKYLNRYEHLLKLIYPDIDPLKNPPSIALPSTSEEIEFINDMRTNKTVMYDRREAWRTLMIHTSTAIIPDGNSSIDMSKYKHRLDMMCEAYLNDLSLNSRTTVFKLHHLSRNILKRYPIMNRYDNIYQWRLMFYETIYLIKLSIYRMYSGIKPVDTNYVNNNEELLREDMNRWIVTHINELASDQYTTIVKRLITNRIAQKIDSIVATRYTQDDFSYSYIPEAFMYEDYEYNTPVGFYSSALDILDHIHEQRVSKVEVDDIEGERRTVTHRKISYPTSVREQLIMALKGELTLIDVTKEEEQLLPPLVMKHLYLFSVEEEWQAFTIPHPLLQFYINSAGNLKMTPLTYSILKTLPTDIYILEPYNEYCSRMYLFYVLQEILRTDGIKTEDRAFPPYVNSYIGDVEQLSSSVTLTNTRYNINYIELKYYNVFDMLYEVYDICIPNWYPAYKRLSVDKEMIYSPPYSHSDVMLYSMLNNASISNEQIEGVRSSIGYVGSIVYKPMYNITMKDVSIQSENTFITLRYSDSSYFQLLSNAIFVDDEKIVLRPTIMGNVRYYIIVRWNDKSLIYSVSSQVL